MNFKSTMKKIHFRLLWEYKKRTKKVFFRNGKYVRWGVIGLGNMADYYSKILTIDPKSIIVAVASRDLVKARSFAHKHKISRFYGKYEDLVEKEKNNIDFIYIATPTNTHFEYIELCLKNKYNVLCEKPMVNNLNDLTKLYQIADENNVILIEALWTHFLPTINASLEWVKNREVGDINFIRVNFYKKIDYQKTKSAYMTTDKMGIFNDFAIYALAMLPLIAKNEVTAISKTQIDSSEYGISDLACQIRIGNINITIDISSKLAADSNLVIYGTKGYILFASPFNRTNKVLLFDNGNNLLKEQIFKYKMDGYEHQINFINNIYLNKDELKYREFVDITRDTISLLDKIRSVKND